MGAAFLWIVNSVKCVSDPTWVTISDLDTGDSFQSNHYDVSEELGQMRVPHFEH